MSLTEQLRDAVRRAKVSRYRLEQLSGGKLSQVELGRFVRGTGWLGPDKMNCLGELLGLSVTVKARNRTSKC